MDLFNRQAQQIIEKFEYDFHIVKQIKEKKCPCVNHNTKQADPLCKLCLGTGFKIRIKQIRGGSQDTDMPTTQRAPNDIVIGTVFYIKECYEVFKENLIFTENEIFKVHEVRKNSGYRGEYCFNKVLTIRKKHHSKAVINNFKEIVSKGSC